MFRRIWVLGSVLAVTAALASAASAAGKTYQVAGRQIVTDEQTGASIVRGGIRGTWDLTGFTEDTDPATPLQGTGTEHFAGCLNRNHDHSCKGDPKGTLDLSFEYWAVINGGALVWGSCYHPITSGTGAFKGAQGVFMMVDSPTPNSVKTRYIGTITLAGGHRTASAAAVPAACG
jgi:hypothetical protein